MYIVLWNGSPKKNLDSRMREIVTHDEISVFAPCGAFWQSRELYGSYDDAYTCVQKLWRYWDIVYYAIFELKETK